MVMSRKHYHEVAEIIKAERDAWENLDPNMLAAVKTSTFIITTKLATMFALDNPLFDRNKFYQACGFDE